MLICNNNVIKEMITITNKDYDKLVKQKTPSSKTLKNCIKAFVIGGIICVIGQAILNFWQSLPLDDKSSAALTSASLIFLSAFLTSLGIYDNIAKHAGAGTLVPITGFSNAVVSPAMEFKSEGLIMGVGAKMFVIAGPVIVYGLLASVIYGIIYYLTTVWGA